MKGPRRENSQEGSMTYVRLAAALLLAAVVAGPAQAQFNPLSAIKGAVEAAVEDRSSSDIAADAKIKASITTDVISKLEIVSVNSDVYEQDVMLTGTVKTAKLKTDAEALTKKVTGVKKIYNEIQVIPEGTEQKGAVSNFVDDSVIETKINAQLGAAKGVNVTNFRWRSVGGKVFLFGRALTKQELDDAVKTVKGIDKVSAVTPHVKVVPKKK
jgi:hyperosmotically inducible protein